MKYYRTSTRLTKKLCSENAKCGESVAYWESSYTLGVKTIITNFGTVYSNQRYIYPMTQ